MEAQAKAKASARYVRVAPQKARRVVDMIRGLPTGEAQALLRFAPQSASETVGKVLDSAVANAEHNHDMDPRTLVVSEAYVDEGPTLKRFRPRAQGRAYRIRKRTSHITVVVGASTTSTARTGSTASTGSASTAAPTKKGRAR